MRACGKRVKAQSIDGLSDWPEQDRQAEVPLPPPLKGSPKYRLTRSVMLLPISPPAAQQQRLQDHPKQSLIQYTEQEWRQPVENLASRTMSLRSPCCNKRAAKNTLPCVFKK